MNEKQYKRLKKTRSLVIVFIALYLVSNFLADELNFFILSSVLFLFSSYVVVFNYLYNLSILNSKPEHKLNSGVMR
ncbi:MAG: hypothetical protein FJ213_11205 [Ignavibacteria bacterium]|nr:hypothetical protein [Ignavibacteria bacterium]